jgi:asparagine synthase (glutamine-hydrolysing)
MYPIALFGKATNTSKREVETRTDEGMIQGVRKHLLDAVRDRLRADVPIGVFLSGGIDSSAIAGMVKHLMETEGVQLGTAPASERINCFSVKFIGEEHDEEPIARRTAEWLGVKMHHCEMTEEKFAGEIENAVWHNEAAVTDLGTVGKFLLSKLTSDEGIKVVLTGEGSDEHFAGYRELLTDFVREPDLASPNSGLSEEVRIQTFNEHDGAATSGPRELETSAAARAQVNNTSFLGFTQTASLRDTLFAHWVFREFGRSDKRLTAVNALDGRTRELMSKKWHPLHTSLYIWIKTSLANGLLTVLGDRCEMAHSVEGRQPFLDHRLTEYAMALPPSVKLRYDPATKSFSEKWILKEAMKPFITPELYARKKHPFSAPVKYKPDGPVHKLFESLITKENVEALGFLEWESCKGLLHDAIYDGDRPKWSQMILVGQFVILSKRFGVRKAAPEFGGVDGNGSVR